MTTHVRKDGTVWDDDLGEIGRLEREIIRFGPRRAMARQWTAMSPEGDDIGKFYAQALALAALRSHRVYG